MNRATNRNELLHRIPPRMRERAGANRHTPTQPERILWSLLRKKRLGGLKFRRQAVIGPYVADFCCPSLRLVVEVDGQSHVGRGNIDAQRTRVLEAQGYRVVRVTNDEVLRNVLAVGLAILKEAGIDASAPQTNAAINPPPRPLPEREGE